MINATTPEQFSANGKASIKAVEALTANAYASMEKLVELNLAATKAMMSESFGSLKAVMGAKDPQDAFTLQAAMFQPLAEKSVAYGRHVYAIVSESSAEFSKSVEDKMAEAQKGFGALVGNLTKNAPAGSETAVAFFKSTMAASQNAIDSAKKAADTVQANMTAVSEQAIKATAGAYKKA